MSSENTVEVWKTPKQAKLYLERVRGGIPLAEEQFQVMLYVLTLRKKSVSNFLDLGCGNGILASVLLKKYPKAKGVLLDFSDPMLKAAAESLKAYKKQLVYHKSDYSKPKWVEEIKNYSPFDVIVSGYSIHHQPDKRKKSLYKEIYHLLKKDGFFINIEHVSSPSRKLEKLWDEYMIDSMYSFYKKTGGKNTRKRYANEYYHRKDKRANILASIENQCDWLRQIGFKDVDCYLKVFELTVFGGRKG